ncbi:suppressor protein SRP40-like isoform X2 [Daphnia magna]|uniref:suppressor protein SRP40-like isoform X2 n=1 Tax=Daphnia magna TaxID=35525 RepID=UPI001E1BBA41|nr:suppressor protein SRP40-like isoform X2 [Daphnia magna]
MSSNNGKNNSRSRNPPMHRFAEPQPTIPTNEEITAQEARLLALRAAMATNGSVRPLRVAAKTIRNKNKRLVAVDKSHLKLFKENGVQSICLVHSPNSKGTSWGHNVCGPDAQKLINSPIGREFLASWKKMSDGLQAGVVPLSQPALVENSLDVGQPLLENRRTTTPVNKESTQGDDVERYASPVNRSSMSESDSNFLAQSDIQTTPVQFPIVGGSDVAASMSAESNSSSSAQSDVQTTPVQFPIFGDADVAASMSAESNSSNSAQSDVQTTPVQFPIFGDADVAASMSAESNSSSSAQCDIHTTPSVQFPFINDTDFEGRAAESSPNSSIHTQPLHQTSRSSTPCPSGPFIPIRQNMIDTSPISRISPFLFPMFSGQDRASPWTRPPTPKPCKLNDTTVAPKKRGRTPVSANCASQSKVNSEKVNNTQVPSGGDLGDNRVAPLMLNQTRNSKSLMLFYLTESISLKFLATKNSFHLHLMQDLAFLSMSRFMKWMLLDNNQSESQKPPKKLRNVFIIHLVYSSPVLF